MNFLKKKFFVMSILVLAISVLSCSKDDTEPQEQPPVDQNAPTCSFSSPANNSSYEIGDVIALTAEAEDADGTIAQVDFYLGAEKIGTDNSLPYTLSYNTENASAGTHKLKAIATDNDGKTTEATISVSITEATGLEVISVSSTITEDQTWLNGKIYKLSTDTQIKATVTIEPGCIIKVKGKLKIKEGGRIIAEGTADKPIRFTSKNKNIGGNNNSAMPEQGDWDYFAIHTSDNIFAYCIFEYAYETIETWENDLNNIFDHCTFRYNWYGIKIERRPGDDMVFTNNRFYNNQYAMSITPLLKLGTTNMFTDETGTEKNTYQCIDFVTIGFQGGITLEENVRLEETEIAFHSAFSFQVKENSSFTLAQNVVLKMGNTYSKPQIRVYSGSSFVMESNSFVTSYYDDEKLGDSDNTDKEPVTGDWFGVKENGSYTPNMTNVLYSEHSSSK